MTIVFDDSIIGGEETNLIDYCISIILKEAKQEDRLVRQLMYTMLSTYTNNPLNLGINSPSGEGKNWALERVSEKFPQEDIQSLSGMTEKALFHKKGVLVIRNEQGEYEEVNTIVKEIDSQIESREYEIVRTKDLNLVKGLKSMIKEFEEEKKEIYGNAVKLIDLQHKILVFLDTPPMGLLSALMSLLAHDKFEAEYEYADISSGITTRTNILRGWPVVIYAQAIDYSKFERWPEIQRRFIITNPQMDSKEKVAQAVDLSVDKFGLPDKIYQKVVSSDDEKNTVREIIKLLKESILNISSQLKAGKNPTFVPFTEALKSGLPKDKSQEMNSGKRFSIILSLLGLINIDKRPRIKIVTKGNPIIDVVPLAVFEDLRESIYLMEYANGVRPYVLEWYYKAFEEKYYSKTEVDSKVKVFNKGNQVVYEDRIAVTTKELIQITKEVNGKSYTSNQLLQTFIYPLMNQGYIDSQESELDHRSHIYFPVVTREKNIIYNKSATDNNFLQPGKLHIRDFTTFPSKSYLISRFQWFLKYYYEDGFLATIYDHEDKEIRIEELIDRYYQNPEDYFTDSEPSEAPPTNPDTGDDDDSNSNTQKNIDIDIIPKSGSNNNISETSKTGSSRNETDTNMQELEGLEVEDSKKLLSTGNIHNIIFSGRQYSDFLVDGVPVWEKENRGMTQEEAEVYRNEVARIGRNKFADMAAANESGNRLLDKGDA